METKCEEFLFGVSYCPYAKSMNLPNGEWEYDIRNMKDLGFNVIRVFSAWDRIESREGEYDFSELDFIFELVGKYQMHIILNVGGVFDAYGGIYPPAWLRKYDCHTIIYNPHIRTRNYGPLLRICMDDPVYREKALKFTEILVQRYSRYECLVAWNVWNEPFLRNTCFCDASVSLFRLWLKKRYNFDLDKLNKAWSSEFPVRYSSWEEIEPPLDAGFSGGALLPRMEWLLFNEENLASKVKEIHSLVKKYDKKLRPTTLNIDYSSPDKISETHRCCNVWEMGKSVDVIGFSHYTLGLKLPEDAFLSAARLTRISSASTHPLKKFKIIETEAGPVKSKQGLNSEGKRRRLLHWQAVAYGAENILCWKYRGRISDIQTDEFNMVAWDGEVTERAKINGQTANEICGFGKKLSSMYTKTQVAILASANLSLFNEITKTQDIWRDSYLGAFEFFFRNNIPCDFIDTPHIESDMFVNTYRVLVLPWCSVLEKKTLHFIADFIKRGGLVIADGCPAARNERLIQNLQAPGNNMIKVFGGYVNDIRVPYKEENILISEPAGIKLPFSKLAFKLHPNKNAEILGSFSWQDPAVIFHKYFEGAVLWIAADIFSSYRYTKYKDDVDTFLLNILKEFNIYPEYSVYDLAGREIKDGVEIRKMENQKGDSFIFVINYTENNQDLYITESPLIIREKRNFPEIKHPMYVRNILTGQKIKTENKRLILSIPALDLAVLHCSSVSPNITP